MKKSASPEQDRVRQPRTGGVRGKAADAVAKAKTVELSPARIREPVGLLPEHASNHKAHAVNFEYFSPLAREVCVAGSFNGWQPGAMPMTKQRGGKWWTEVLLQPGQYEYRFVVDGQWQDDPMAARFAANPFGALNGVIEVKPMTTAAISRP